PQVHADPDGIHRAILNIVGNALDAVEDRENAQVTLGTRTADDEWVRVIVLDNGHGIAADKIKEIFVPFVSTKGAKGTGLGLPVSRKIFREHGGDIIVESKVGKGSKFIMRLPMRSPHLNEVNQTAHMPALPPDE